jgi:hypothetical protein
MAAKLEIREICLLLRGGEIKLQKFVDRIFGGA